MNKDIELGLKLGKVSEAYYFDELIGFLKGNSKRGGMYFEHLKPLYDEYGYKEVNDTLVEIYDREHSTKEETKEVKADE